MSGSVRLRLLLAVPAVLALLCGVLAGLARLGLPLPAQIGKLVPVHRALMTGGFFGTLIGLERAVALGRSWPYLAPAFSGLAVVALLFDASAALPPVLMSLAAVCMGAACASVWRKQREMHLATLVIAALAWLLGNLLWVVQGAVFAAVPLWAAFLLLTIAAERLELSRMIPTPPWARRVFAVIVVVLLVSAAFSALRSECLRIFALSLLALAAWLLRYDIARRTIKSSGLTRYMAVCLLSGYLWLGVAAMLGMSGAFQTGNAWRDAGLHALLLGFVVAMVFGHAPVILPAITRLKVHWHRGFYLPLVLLHLTLLARVVAGLAGNFPLRQYAALGNALTLLLFVVVVAASILRRPSSAI